MPTESELRDLLHDGSGPSRELDAARIIRRARARRLPKQLAAGAGGVLAVAALAIPVTIGGSLGGLSPASDDSAGGDSAFLMDEPGDAALESATRAAPDELVCGGEAVGYVAHPDGLQLRIANPNGASAPTTEMELELRNEGEDLVTGTMPATVSVALVQDGVVVAVDEIDATDRVDVDLAPRATMPLRAELPLTTCDIGDGAAGEPVPAGDYDVVALARFERADGSSAPVVAWPWRFEVVEF